MLLQTSSVIDELLALQADLVDYLNIRKSKYTAESFSETDVLVNPRTHKDKYCDECEKRYALLKLVAGLREGS